MAYNPEYKATLYIHRGMRIPDSHKRYRGRKEVKYYENCKCRNCVEYELNNAIPMEIEDDGFIESEEVVHEETEVEVKKIKTSNPVKTLDQVYTVEKLSADMEKIKVDNQDSQDNQMGLSDYDELWKEIEKFNNEFTNLNLSEVI